MERVTFKSLFDVADKVESDLNIYFSELDNKLIDKFYQLKSFLDSINYIDNYRFRKTSKMINNLLLVNDFAKLKNYKIDLLTLITKDISVNNTDISHLEKKINYLFWFHDWINFTKIDLSKFESSKLFVKYIRKQLNNNHFVRTYKDTDYFPMLDDIFDFIYSNRLEKYPIIKLSIVIKQLFYLTPILSLEVLFTIIIFLIRKYHLDINSSLIIFFSFLFDNKNDFETSIAVLQKMPLIEFCEIIKKTLLKAIDFTIDINNDIYNFINTVDNLNDIDQFHPNEFKKMFSTELTIDYQKFFLNEIYFTRYLYNKKIDELTNNSLIKEVVSKQTSVYINSMIYNLICLIDAKKESLNYIN